MVPEINLLPSFERKTTKNRLFVVVLLSLFGVLLIYFVYQQIALTKSLTVLEQEQQQLLDEKITLEQSLTELDQPKELTLEDSVTFIESVSYPVSPLIKEINKYIHSSDHIENYSFAETTVRFSIFFTSLTEIANYVENLSGSRYFSDVKVDQVSLNEENGGYSNTFTVTIDLHYLRTGGEAK